MAELQPSKAKKKETCTEAQQGSINVAMMAEL